MIQTSSTGAETGPIKTTQTVMQWNKHTISICTIETLGVSNLWITCLGLGIRFAYMVQNSSQIKYFAQSNITKGTARQALAVCDT